jgi:hypothetical protein
VSTAEWCCLPAWYTSLPCSEISRRGRDVDGLGLQFGFPVVEGFDLGECFGVFFNQVTDLPQDLGPL